MNYPPSTSSHSPSWKWWVCGVLFLATLLLYMDRLVLPQTATEMKQSYAIGDARYGVVERNFSWAFAVGSILFGLVADAFGPRLVYPFVLLGWSAAGLATPLLQNRDVTDWVADPGDPASGPYNWLLLCRTLLGLFEAGHWPCALITARQVLIARDRPFGNGILQSGASIGAVLVPPYVMALRHLGLGWAVAFWTIGAMGILWVPFWLALVRRGDLSGDPSHNAFSAQHSPSAPFRLLPFLRIYLSLFAVIIGLTISWQFPRAWLPKYLKESQGFSKDVTDVVVACYYLTADIGCLASGTLVRWLVRRGRTVHAARLTGYAVFATAALASAFVPAVGGGWAGVILLTLTACGVLGLHPYYYALAQDLPHRWMGFLSGLLAATGWFVVGYVQKALGARIEATGSYDVGFVLVGIAPMLGLMALVLLWRRPISA